MAFNRIGWCHETKNPFVGCTFNCSFGNGGRCYARDQARRQKQHCRKCYDFTPHYHLDRLKQITPGQKPRRIFIGSMADIADFIGDEELGTVMDHLERCRQHTFLMLTKRPGELNGMSLPGNVWMGVSITRKADMGRLRALTESGCSGHHNYFVSFEPLLEDPDWCPIQPVRHIPRWIIIGGLSRRARPPLHPRGPWVSGILVVAGTWDIPVYMKDNIGFDQSVMRREFPEGMPVYGGEMV